MAGDWQGDWTEIKVSVPARDVETAGNIANMTVPYGIYIEDYSDVVEETLEIAHVDLISEELLEKDRTKGIIHIYISPEENPAEAVSFLDERLKAQGVPHEIAINECKTEDWINNWKNTGIRLKSAKTAHQTGVGADRRYARQGGSES